MVSRSVAESLSPRFPFAASCSFPRQQQAFLTLQDDCWEHGAASEETAQEQLATEYTGAKKSSTCQIARGEILVPRHSSCGIH